jgi:riboflavin biosynthesis pyrimidine reductase
VLLFVAPLIVGRGAPDLFAAPAVRAVDRAWRLTGVEWRQVCDDLLVSGSVVKGRD